MTDRELAIFLIGLCIGAVIIAVLWLLRDYRKDFGKIVVDTSSQEVDKYSLEISKPLDDLPKEKYILLFIETKNK